LPQGTQGDRSLAGLPARKAARISPRINAMKTEINAFRQKFVTEPKPAIKKSKKKSNKIKLVG